MPTPDHLWIVIDFGGASTKVAFPSADDTVVNLSFPTLFHYLQGQDKEGGISVADSAIFFLDNNPEGVLLLKKSKMTRNHKVSLPNGEVSIPVFDLLTRFFIHIRTHCEQHYFHGNAVQTCVLPLPFPYRTLHRLLNDVAIAAGFQEVLIRDHAVAVATAWYQNRCFQSTTHVLVCDIGGDTGNFVLLKHRHHGFERIPGSFSLHSNRGGNDIQQAILNRVLKQIKKNPKTEERLRSWTEKTNAFFVKIRDAKETYWSTGNLAPYVSVGIGKKKIELKENDIIKASLHHADRLCHRLKLLLDHCVKNQIDLHRTSLVLAGNGALLPLFQEKIKALFPGNIFASKSQQCNAATGAVYLINSNPATIVSRNQDVQRFSACYIAAITGDSVAQYQLGKCYAYGYGTAIIPEESFFWFQRSAEQGNAKAMYQLGKCYQIGWGVFSDVEQSIHFFQQSAQLGYVKSQYRLGRVYSSRKANLPDLDKARFWFDMAAKNGHKDAVRNLKMLEARHGMVPANDICPDTFQSKRKRVIEHFIGAFLSCVILFFGGVSYTTGSGFHPVVMLGGASLVVLSLITAIYAIINLFKFIRFMNKSTGETVAANNRN